MTTQAEVKSGIETLTANMVDLKTELSILKNQVASIQQVVKETNTENSSFVIPDDKPFLLPHYEETLKDMDTYKTQEQKNTNRYPEQITSIST